MPEVVLTVSGKRHAGWKSIGVQSGLRQLAATFTLDFTDRWPGQQEKYVIAEGSRCTVSLDGQVVIDGWVDRLSPSYDTGSHALSLSGRDLCGDLADCCHTGARVDFAGETLPAIAQALCQPFGVTAVAEADCGAPLAKARYGQGETVHEFLLKLCRLRGVLPVSHGDGRLILTTAGQTSSGARLIQGRNIVAARAEFNSADRHNEYVVKGQGQAPAELDYPPASDEDAEERDRQRSEFICPSGRAVDNAVRRHRPLVLLAEGGGDPASMQARARWEAVNRAGHSRAVSYTVQGWRAPGGGLWRCNQLVSVEDGLLGIWGQQLIESLSFRLDDSCGAITELGLVHPDAYAANPAEDQASGVKSKFDPGD